jgi:hypothetical protein
MTLVTKEDKAFSGAFTRTTAFWPTGAAQLREADGERSLTVSTVCAISAAPPIVSVSIANESPSLEWLAPGGSVRLALEAESGSDPLATLSGAVRERIPMGDHTVVFLDIDGAAHRAGRPRVYWRRAMYTLRIEHSFLESPAILDRFVAAWRAGRIPLSAWTHGAHVGVGAYHAFGQTLEEAHAAMRTGILNFNELAGVPNTDTRGYHETLTWFWCARIREFLDENPAPTRFAAAQAAVAEFGEDRDLHRLYYSWDVVRDVKARREVVAPDLAPVNLRTPA